MRMPEKSVVRTEDAPAPYQGAPYSQAIRVGDLVFVSGQLSLRPGESELVGDTIGEQTEQVLTNLAAILEAAGSGLDRLVKTTVFLANLADFQGMNEVYARRVGERPPARSTVEVAALPSGALLEIEAVAHL
jgi:2-iminobutanoate/2-iminopropanoate deaminase